MELLKGARNKSEETKLKRKLLRFNTASINNEITLKALELFENYRISHGLALPDCMIAATSLILELDLFTHNVKDYKFMRKLDLYEH